MVCTSCQARGACTCRVAGADFLQGFACMLVWGHWSVGVLLSTCMHAMGVKTRAQPPQTDSTPRAGHASGGGMHTVACLQMNQSCKPLQPYKHMRPTPTSETLQRQASSQPHTLFHRPEHILNQDTIHAPAQLRYQPQHPALLLDADGFRQEGLSAALVSCMVVVTHTTSSARCGRDAGPRSPRSPTVGPTTAPVAAHLCAAVTFRPRSSSCTSTRCTRRRGEHGVGCDRLQHHSGTVRAEGLSILPQGKAARPVA